MDDHPLFAIVATATALATAIWTGWCTVIAFVGGTMPLLGWEVEGSVGFGLFWLFIVDPILITVAYWASLLVMLPFAAVGAWRDRGRG